MTDLHPRAAGGHVIAALAEPFFLNFNADCRFRIVMTPEDLGKAGLDALADKWG